MAQWPQGFTRISPPPVRWSFRPPPPPPPPSDEKTSSQGRIIAGIFIGMVTSLLVFTIVCSLCRGHQNRRARTAAAAPALRPRLPLPERRVRHDERHLRQACAASSTTSLPAFTYSRSVKHNVTGEGEEAVTCSVCLSAFQLGEKVRLLPVCLHLYHVECIDLWLDEHSTCPLCRSDTDPSSRVLPA